MLDPVHLERLVGSALRRAERRHGLPWGHLEYIRGRACEQALRAQGRWDPARGVALPLWVWYRAYGEARSAVREHARRAERLRRRCEPGRSCHHDRLRVHCLDRCGRSYPVRACQLDRGCPCGGPYGVLTGAIYVAPRLCRDGTPWHRRWG